MDEKIIGFERQLTVPAYTILFTIGRSKSKDLTSALRKGFDLGLVANPLSGDGIPISEMSYNLDCWESNSLLQASAKGSLFLMSCAYTDMPPDDIYGEFNRYELPFNAFDEDYRTISEQICDFWKNNEDLVKAFIDYRPAFHFNMSNSVDRLKFRFSDTDLMCTPQELRPELVLRSKNLSTIEEATSFFEKQLAKFFFVGRKEIQYYINSGPILAILEGGGQIPLHCIGMDDQERKCAGIVTRYIPNRRVRFDRYLPIIPTQTQFNTLLGA